ncbi:MAG: hypothetical protein H7Y17_00640 [Chlorobia bacterium]|nr:hypothetical protein [Fimbriimonadaceae bacterium]
MAFIWRDLTNLLAHILQLWANFATKSRASSSDAWAVLSTCTKRTFETSWTPGSYVAFRVSAQRRGVTSAACTPVVLWDGESVVALKLAA